MIGSVVIATGAFVSFAVRAKCAQKQVLFADICDIAF